jgi:hypothetical protein
MKTEVSDPIDFSQRLAVRAKRLWRTKHRRSFLPAFCLPAIVLICQLAGEPAQAQTAAPQAAPDATTNANSGTPAEQMTALELERTNAWKEVLQIINHPVKAYVRSEDMAVSVYSPGWFHPGATKPAFNSVDVRQSQELIYTSKPYVTSDLNPGVVFMGQDLEFNAMTKYFYVDRSLPKHKLTEPQMLEINRLYRIIGRCETDMARLESAAGNEAASSETSASDTEQAAPPAGIVGRISSIPRETRLRYGGIGIGVLIVLAVGLRLVRRKAD